MKIRNRISLSIGQSILLSTMSIVSLVLLVSSFVYFMAFSARTNVLVENQSREINKQIVLNYESYIESIIETANYIQRFSLPLDLKTDYEQLQNLYTLNSQLKKDVVAIFLFNEEGIKLLGDRIGPLSRNYILSEPWFTGALSDPSIFHFLSSGKSSLAIDRKDEVISVAKQVNYIRGGISEIGVLLIELNFQVIRDLAEMTNLGHGGHILILDGGDALIYTSENPYELTDRSLDIAAEHVLGGLKTSIEGRNLFLNINTLAHTRWRIATLINIDEIDAIRRSMLPVFLLIFAITMVTTTLVSIILSLRISLPVKQLQRIMFKIEQGAIDTEVSVKGQKEIVMLGHSFNSMIEKIRVLMDRVVTEQREKRKTELRALQNQINPHFLYNSLDSIVWLAEHERSEDVVTTVIALARFFRISISKGATFIPVSDEIDHVKNYLTIQSIRYVDKFTYSFDIDERLMSMNVMKLILQPLVENAIHHGLDEDGGVIEIRGRLEPGWMFFDVRNNGYGLTEKRIEEIQNYLEGMGEAGPGIGVGLRNVQQRLKLYYGENAGLRFSGHSDEDTIVTVIIPLAKDSAS